MKKLLFLLVVTFSIGSTVCAQKIKSKTKAHGFLYDSTNVKIKSPRDQSTGLRTKQPGTKIKPAYKDDTILIKKPSKQKIKK